MEPYVTIDGADYCTLELDDKHYFIGEETVLDSEYREVGYICSRGPQTWIAVFDEYHNKTGERFSSYGYPEIDTDEALVKYMLTMREASSRG